MGVVTINLPRIGYEAAGEEEFLEILGQRMDLAKESLDTKRQVLERFTDRGLYPYSRYYLREVKKRFGAYWKNHFSTIGIVGMNDALLNLLGTDISTPEGIEFSLRALEFMRRRLADYQEETGDIFNLEATPAEGTSYRLARLDQEKYPDLKVYNLLRPAGGGARAGADGVAPFTPAAQGTAPYYSNSTLLPVGYTDDVFTALRLQDPLQALYTGGTVLHCFLGEKMPSPEAARTLVKTIAENFHLPYYTLTPTFSVCPEHGYLSGGHPTCPECGAVCEVWSRSVGYLRPVDQWNPGKQQEFGDRRTYDRQLVEQDRAG